MLSIQVQLLLNYLTLTLQPFTLYCPDVFVVTSSFSLSEVELFYQSVCKITFSVLLCLLLPIETPTTAYILCQLCLQSMIFPPSFLYLSLLNNIILTYNKFIPSLAQLRNHLNNAIKHQGQPNAVNLTNPETLQLHLETRLAQLESAINMELWQVCHIIREKQSLHSEALNSACSCSVNGIFTNSLNSSSLCCRYSTGHRHCSTYMRVNCVQYGGFPRKIHAKNLRVNFYTSFYMQTFYTQI